MARILVGVAGSIAAYRSPDLVKALKANGHEVRVVLTHSAAHFVTTKTLETFAATKVFSNDVWDGDRLGTEHIDGARWANIVLVYGATAQLMAKLAHGFCDDFLSLQILATTAPVVLCPAMNVEMWKHAATQANFATLEARGVKFIGPIGGRLACGEEGLGHVADVATIVANLPDLDAHPATTKFFSGRKVLLSMGSMRTALDDVRFLQNSSSGRMGLELARALLAGGAEVSVLAGLIDFDVERYLNELHAGHKQALRIARFATVAGYKEFLDAEFLRADVFISAAAVLDFEVEVAPGKLHRDTINSLNLKLRATPDFVAWTASVKRPEQLVVAFALESGSWETAVQRAGEKLRKKGADILVVNRAGIEGEGPYARTNSVKVLTKSELLELVPEGATASKSEIARKILEAIERLVVRNAKPLATMDAPL